MKTLYQKIGGVALSVLIAQMAGIIGSFFTASSVKGWYALLEKPSWTPPGSWFGPVWTTLYALMGIAAFSIYEQTREKGRVRALQVYAAQLAVNAAWSVVFFGWHSPGGAFAVIVALWLLIVATMIQFWRLRPVAGALLIPYLVWVTFASMLNFQIWRLN